MGGATPDAYRIGTGQVARDYPADAAPVRLRKQPSLPTVARAPESSLVEQVVSAEDAVVRGKAPGSPRPSRKSRPSEDAAAVLCARPNNEMVGSVVRLPRLRRRRSRGAFKALVSEVPLGARPRLVVPARLSRAWIAGSVRRIAGVPSSSSRSASCPPSSS